VEADYFVRTHRNKCTLCWTGLEGCLGFLFGWLAGWPFFHAYLGWEWSQHIKNYVVRLILEDSSSKRMVWDDRMPY
jgi:hypothetical protein